MVGGAPENRLVNQRRLSASVPCTCGELFQGSLDGEACLVSCPINCYSTASLTDPQTNPSKPGRKVRLALSFFNNQSVNPEAVCVRNLLPAGRGFGTSTADIGAALFMADNQLTAEQAAQIAVRVEPSDSTFFPGLTLFAHRTGKFLRYLGAAPAASLLVVDPGGYVDTQCFNAQDWNPQLKELAAEHQIAFDMLQMGIETTDLEAIGQAASLSAHLHQSILDNPMLNCVTDIAAQIGAFGVCRAHSGTVLGILLEAGRDDQSDLLAFCRERLPVDAALMLNNIVGGGPRLNVEGEMIPEGRAA